jgi:diaminohydroxyphosphoribosylaminopyrimidine deaminase/5-amino-6-(5-phosphoribosylamino)uracil reductase
MTDPDARVAGKGFERLRAAGVVVDIGLMTAEASSVNCGFLTRQAKGRPWLTLKMASTLDGRIATAQGESRWITGPAARAEVHLMRGRADAILIGSGTALDDDPRLDVRLPGMSNRMPVRVVADSTLRQNADSQLARSAHGAAPVWRLCRQGATGSWGTVIPVAANEANGIDLSDALTILGARGITRILCEGGGQLAGALMRAGLVDELVWISAGAALGAEARPALGALGIEVLADAPRFHLRETRTLGADVLSAWSPI